MASDWHHLAPPGITWHYVGVTLASSGITLALHDTSIYANLESCCPRGSGGFHTMLGPLFDTKIDLNPSKSLSKLPSHDSDLKVLAMCLDIYQKVPVDA